MLMHLFGHVLEMPREDIADNGTIRATGMDLRSLTVILELG